MPKLYDFRFIIRSAKFTTNIVTVGFGSANTYHESYALLGFKEAQEHLKHLSAKEPRSHCASLSMKYRDERKPAGFSNLKDLFHNEIKETS